MFRVGQKVARISGEARFGEDIPYPEMGEACTVANVYVSQNGVEMIELLEYPNPETDEVYAGFVAAHFRPVVARKTDISIFTAMLNPAKKKRRADRAVTVS